MIKATYIYQDGHNIACYGFQLPLNNGDILEMNDGVYQVLYKTYNANSNCYCIHVEHIISSD